MKDPYARNRGAAKGGDSGIQRVVVLMPKDEVEAVDGWGVPAGMESRTAAVRMLVKKGLEAAGRGRPAQPA